jgi:signal peptide peptidase SppA
VKYPTPWDDLVPAVEIAAALREAIANPDVEVVELSIDSPGGLIAGTTEFAELVAELGKIKPIDAVVSDFCGSGAYYIASQCRRISANRHAEIGSIGAFQVLTDTSELDKQIGLKFVLITTGGVKGLGANGVVTPELITDQQRITNEHGALFREAVARGRKFSPDEIAALADGRVVLAEEALRLRLIDEVLTAGVPAKEVPMDQNEFLKAAQDNPDWVKPLVENAIKAQAEPPATIDQLEADFPGDEKFVVAQLKAKATLSGAREAHRKLLASQVSTLKSEKEQAEARLAERDPGNAGITAPLNLAGGRSAQTTGVGADPLGSAMDRIFKK